MAKKKQTRKRKAEPKSEEPSLFWPIVWGIVLIVLAILLYLGAFSAGGPLPQSMHEGLVSIFGIGAFIATTGVMYLGVLKLASKDKKIPLVKGIFTILSVILISTFIYVVTAKKDALGQYSSQAGGFMGGAIGNLLLGLLSTVLSSITLIILISISICLATGLPLKTLLVPFKALFQRRSRKDEDTDLSELKQNNRLKLNEGVPTIHHDREEIEEKPRSRTRSLRNTAQKLTPTEDHAALVTKSDSDWKFPDISLLNQKEDKADAGDYNGNAEVIKETFEHFGIDVAMEEINIGPRVTQYTLKPPTGVRLNKITALEGNLALDLAAPSIRMEAPIPGKRAVGIEVPNIKPATVRMSSLVRSKEWSGINSPLGFAIGKDISGLPFVGDLAKMPHLMVAGTTGSGKSGILNTFLASLLYRNSPTDLKLILVDPKYVEMGIYDNIPHLLTPVITEPEKVISALKWSIAEMERRLKAMASVGKRNIAEYNELKKEESMPYIVIVIDELADLMMVAARDAEALIARLAAKARAAGIHLVLATQRPSVDVVTGVIKANIPARIALTTQSQVDSRTIIDQVGAEKLLGKGDMLIKTSDMLKPKRMQSAFIDTDEITRVVDFIRMQRPPEYDDEVVSQPVQLNGKGGVVFESGNSDHEDELFEDAVRAVIAAGKASVSLVQRRLRVGYGRASRLIETMEEQGIVGPADGSRPREVLVRSLDEVFGDNESDDDTDTGDDSNDESGPKERYLVQ